jgi:hypothetical protein
MHYVRAEVVRWVDPEWPGWVEVHLPESDGSVALLVDKVPVFDYGDRLVPGAKLPMSIEIPCHVLDWVVGQGGVRSAFIRLRFDIEDQSGRTIFNVDGGRLAQRS